MSCEESYQRPSTEHALLTPDAKARQVEAALSEFRAHVKKGQLFEGKGVIAMPPYSPLYSPLQFAITKKSSPNEESGQLDDKRVTVQIGVDLNRPADLELIYVPGWGETAGQLSEKELILLEEARKKGFENPRLTILHPCGKGTLDYLNNKDRISELSIDDETKDLLKLLKAFEPQNPADAPPKTTPHVLIGHSMGAMHIKKLAIQLQGWKLPVAACSLEMPALDDPLVALLSLKFLNQVRSRVAEAIFKAIFQTGALQLTPEEYAKIMMGLSTPLSPKALEKIKNSAQFLGNVPASAMQFLEFVLTLGHIDWTPLPPPCDSSQTNSTPPIQYSILSAKEDSLLPEAFAQREAKRLHQKGAPVKLHDYPGGHVTGPYLNQDQRTSLENYYANLIPGKKR